MRVLQQPRTTGLLLGSEQLNRFVDPRVRRISGGSEVLQCTEHVVVPAGWKRGLQPGRIDDFAGALAPEQLSLEEIPLSSASSRDGFRRPTGCAFVRQQTFQDVDRGVERRANRAVLRLAVPPAVLG